MANIVRTPQTYPLNTITREQSSSLNKVFIDFINHVEAKSQESSRLLFLPHLDVPDEFEGKTIWAKYLSPVKNQGQCGGCYAFAAASALADRYNLRTEGLLHLNLSAARIIQCDTVGQITNVIGIEEEQRREETIEAATAVFGCHGNTLLEAWRFLNNMGTNTVECVPDQPIQKTCKQLMGPFYDTCEALSTPTHEVPAVFYRAMHIYIVPGVERDGGSERVIRANIFKYGPLSTAMDIHENFYTFDPTREIYRGTGKVIGGHAVVLDGWGIENGTRFWWVRNSWGPKWGIGGYFKLLRGSNECRAEENILVGAPVVVPIGALDKAEYSVDLLNFPSINQIRRALVSPFTPYGGVDPRTNISRRFLSRSEFQNQPQTRLSNLRVNSEDFVAGLVGSGGGTSSLKRWFWIMLVLCLLAVGGVVIFLLLNK